MSVASGKAKIPLAEAEAIVRPLVELMRPFCERIQVAGSIRRRRPTIGDLEIVAMPRIEHRVCDLFQGTEEVNKLYEWGFDWQESGAGKWVKGFKPSGRYWQAHVPHPARAGDVVQIDLFLTTWHQWGWILLLRTGSADFNKALAQHCIDVGIRGQGGYLRGVTGTIYSTPEEDTVFKLLGLRPVPPDGRIGRDSLFRAGSEVAAKERARQAMEVSQVALEREAGKWAAGEGQDDGGGRTAGSALLHGL